MMIDAIIIVFRNVCAFLFFKRQTAYEMRISVWSSDVCSSDLESSCLRSAHAEPPPLHRLRHAGRGRRPRDPARRGRAVPRFPVQPRRRGGRPVERRSEEHTSELQSLMRISYAVFCLKKKKQHQYLISNRTTNKHAHRQRKHNTTYA